MLLDPTDPKHRVMLEAIAFDTREAMAELRSEITDPALLTQSTIDTKLIEWFGDLIYNETVRAQIALTLKVMIAEQSGKICLN